MKPIEAYQSVDGTIFINKEGCKKHDLDCIGELFDELLQTAMQGTNGNVTRNDQYRMCLELLNKHKELKSVVGKLNDYLNDV